MFSCHGTQLTFYEAELLAISRRRRREMVSCRMYNAKFLEFSDMMDSHDLK
jgi:hypothetical protein